MIDFAPVLPDSALAAIGGDAVAGTHNLAEIALIKDDIAVVPTTTYAELEAAKATYSGYLVQVVTWSDPTRADDGSIEYLGSVPAEFRPTSSVITNAVYGMYVRNAGHTDWLFAAKFPDGPVPMESVLDALILTLRYRPAGNDLIAMLS